MHMADALISPAVGGAMWAATSGLTVYSAKKIKNELDERKVPLMGVLSAFVFAAQMINFSIPATGSSGHLGGGMVLSILLGPYAAFITMASVLTVQALFFADGGLLALGCNIFNLAFFPCFVAYPFIYKKIVGAGLTRGRILLGASLAAIIGLQLGAFGVVLQALFSGISELPFGSFLLMMQPIHLAIGIVEGFLTTAVVSFVWKACPEVLEIAATERPIGNLLKKSVLAGLLVATVLTGGTLSWFASTHPDGLEWAIFQISGKEDVEGPDEGIHAMFADIQRKTAILPDYGFKEGEQVGIENQKAELLKTAAASVVEKEESWPKINGGTSVSGLIGAALTLLLAGLIGATLRAISKRR